MGFGDDLGSQKCISFWPNLGQNDSRQPTCVLEMSQMVFGYPFISLECAKMYSGQDLVKKFPVSTLAIYFTDMRCVTIFLSDLILMIPL